MLATVTTMTAVVVTRHGGPRVLEVVEQPLPEPASTEVLVRVAYAGVHPVDVKTRRGAGVARWVGPPPFVLGWDLAGTVASVGYGVTRFAPGDRVYGLIRFPRQAGTYAELTTAPSRQLATVPSGLDLSVAAAVPLATLTAWQSLAEDQVLRPADRVLVHGAGGAVGHAVLDLATMLGATTVATVRHPRGPEVPSSATAVLSDRADWVDEVIARGPFDVVVDLVGDQDVLFQFLPAVAPGGRIVGIADGVTPQVSRAARRAGVAVLEPLVEPDGHALERVSRLLTLGTLRRPVVDVLPLAEAATAHRRLEAGRLGGTRLVLECDPSAP